MVRTGRRRTRRKLEPPIPEAPDELNLPKYFSMIRSGGYGGAKSGEKRSEEMLPPMSRPDETPKALRTRRPILPRAPYPNPAPEPEKAPLLARLKYHFVSRDSYPNPAPEPEKAPLLARLKYHFVSLFKVEPERPVPMPKVPELNFPALYTRFPVMKTVTKTTDGAGEIAVTYAQSYKTIPGVVISVKDPDNVFGTVFSTALTGFGVRLFKMDHNHGGVVDDDGLHTPTINADGQHSHNVQGTGSIDLDTNYGRLVMSNYTDYEKLHKHTNITSAGGSDHRHVNNPTDYEKLHTHSNPTTSLQSQGHTHTLPSYTGAYDNDDELVANGWSVGTSCASGWCVTGLDGVNVPSTTHYHSLGGNTGGMSHGHTHTQGNTGVGTAADPLGHRHGVGNTQLEGDHTHHIYPTGPGTYVDPLGHRHLISDDILYNHYVYDVGLTLDLVATANESPYHAHSGNQIVKHGHGVAADGRVLLMNTNVTITYIAQEESN